ncbi:MAG: carboxypeptidase-like regulatory domain-containing protein [Planctomycetota bacterium]
MSLDAALVVRSASDGSFAVHAPPDRTWTSVWPPSVRGPDGTLALSRGAPDEVFHLRATRAQPFQSSRWSACRWSERGPGLWVVLRMEDLTRLRARAVNEAGDPVPNATFHVLAWPSAKLRASRMRTLRPAIQVLRGDEHGILDVPIEVGHVRCWARAPDGFFGKSRVGEAMPARPLDLGDVVTCGALHDLSFDIVDGDGRPVATAVARMNVDDAANRWTTGAPGAGVVHARANASGVIRCMVRPRAEPLPVVIGAPGFQTVRVVVPAVRAGKRRYTVALERRPSALFRVRVSDGAPWPHGVVPLAWQLIPSGVGVADRNPTFSSSVPSIWLGGLAPSEEPLAQDGLDPAHGVAMSVGQSDPSFEEESGSYRVTFPAEGSFRVQVSAPVGVRLAAEVEARPIPKTYELVCAPGRVVRVSVTSSRPAGGAYVWAGSATLPADDWPATRPEFAEAMRTAAWLGHAGPMWVSPNATHLAVRAWSGRAGFPVGFEASTTTALPGRERLAGERLKQQPPPLRRFPILRDGSVTIPHAPTEASSETVPVEVQAQWAGRNFEGASVPLEVRSEDGRVLEQGRTDASGVARFRLPPGRYRVRADPQVVESEELPIEVRAGRPPEERFELPLLP